MTHCADKQQELHSEADRVAEGWRLFEQALQNTVENQV